MEKILVNKTITIAEAIQNIQNHKFVIPSFQRDYVWEMKQIEKLWDSIMQGFPISNFLFWHLDEENTTDKMYFCRFLNNFTFNAQRKSDNIQHDCETINCKISDTAILDGQQRLCSIYMSLCGTAGIRVKRSRRSSRNINPAKIFVQLDKNKVENDDTFEEKKFDFCFTDKIANIDGTFFELNNLFTDEFKNDLKRPQAIENAIKLVSETSKDYARNILNTLYNKIFVEKLINYTEIFNMTNDEALEMFIRFNSGGKKLSKSDITASILKNYWPQAPEKINNLLVGDFYNFGTGFIVRNALMIFGDVTKSKIDSLIVSHLKTDWDKFEKSIKLTGELLHKYKIDVNSRFKGSWSILSPIIYSIFMNDCKIVNEDGLMTYLYRAIFFTFYSSATTSKLAKMKMFIKNNGYTIPCDKLDTIQELKYDESKVRYLMTYKKGSNIANEILYHLSKDWIYENVEYDIDHIHPNTRFERSAPIGIPQRTWDEWGRLADQLPNLEYLDFCSNRGWKNGKSLIDYMNEMTPEALEKFKKEAMLPENIDGIYEERNFNKFIEKRSEILIQRINKLIKA